MPFFFGNFPDFWEIGERGRPPLLPRGAATEQIIAAIPLQVVCDPSKTSDTCASMTSALLLQNGISVFTYLFYIISDYLYFSSSKCERSDG